MERRINNCRIFRPLTLPSPPRGEGTEDSYFRPLTLPSPPRGEGTEDSY